MKVIKFLIEATWEGLTLLGVALGLGFMGLIGFTWAFFPFFLAVAISPWFLLLLPLTLGSFLMFVEATFV